MSTITLIAIVALIGYSLYKQTHTHELVRGGRFKMAIVYAVIGICLGVDLPHNPVTVALIAVGLLASIGTGVLRGHRVQIWQDGDGRAFTRGTATTIAFFFGLIAFKFVLGTVAHFAHVPYPSSIGEILLMIGLMMAMQVHVVWQRAERLGFVAPVNADGVAATV